ncbi:N,N'-diacetyllegionaminic acid synthase [Methylobrevis pamukkalensis]|uniref:N,N'-diacetyllegionaminic acid synthase n=1 Tax=Methylobrevis pamukkalensis TaxID=1439726 RepID=A0A1E3GWW4_9HYPH|nr:N,N'-diacetyllegionaminic acid synthase [Methylobrevis pamukkalensis]
MIAINDAERIAPADITLFHADWVGTSLKATGERSRLYVTSTDFHPVRGEVQHARYIPLTQDSSDLMMQRFLSPDFALEEVLFLSALKIARYVAEHRGRPQTVYMAGFDFTAGLGYSHAITADYAPESERATKIDVQEFFFLNTLYVLRDSPLDVQHVGTRAFSRLTPAELNERLLPQPAHPVPEGPDVTPVEIVAELTTNHFGDRHRLERMIRAAAAAGADFVKLQKRDVETFYTAEQLAAPYVSPFGKTFADYRHQLELDADDFGFVDDLCRQLGIGWFASVLDQPSFTWMRQFDPAIIKLPSTISEHTGYLAQVAKSWRGSIVLSTGMTDKAYEAWVLQTFAACDRLYLMQCNSAYPTPLHDCHVGVVRHYHELSLHHRHIVPAFSSHDFGWLASALAVAAGARMVEKHTKLGNTDWAHFDAVAVDLTTSAFKDYVDGVRQAQMIVGSSEKKVNASEHHKYFRQIG